MNIEEIKEGMYIRNEDGYILNLTKENIYGYKSLIGSSNIKIKSHKIIDLIQVGDYVNGYKVTAIYNPNGDDIFNFTLIMEHGYKTINPYIKHYPIKSIVTKEQFESMAYKVEKC